MGEFLEFTATGPAEVSPLTHERPVYLAKKKIAGFREETGAGGTKRNGRSGEPDRPCISGCRSGECRDQFDWCARVDSNHHSLAATWPSTMRVYQFRHGRSYSEAVRLEPLL